MSIILSISSVLSFLSFLTTVLALARVGAAAFASNENRFQAHQLQQSHVGGSVEKGLALAHQTHPHPHNVTKVGLDSDSEKGAEDVESRLKELRAFIAGRQMPKLSSGWSALRKPRITFPPSAAVADRPQKPLSMAKLIMSRHSQRRPSRPPPLRRPPGLPPSPSSRSRLQVVEAV